MRDKQNFISQEQEQEIKDHFYKDVKDLIYWSYGYECSHYKHLFQGIIKKEYYEHIMGVRRLEIMGVRRLERYQMEIYKQNHQMNEKPEN